MVKTAFLRDGVLWKRDVGSFTLAAIPLANHGLELPGLS